MAKSAKKKPAKAAKKSAAKAKPAAKAKKAVKTKKSAPAKKVAKKKVAKKAAPKKAAPKKVAPSDRLRGDGKCLGPDLRRVLPDVALRLELFRFARNSDHPTIGRSAGEAAAMTGPHATRRIDAEG